MGVKIARSGVNLFLPDDPEKNAWSYAKLGVDTWSGIDNYLEYRESMNILKEYKNSPNLQRWSYKKTKGIIQIDGVATRVVSKANVFTGIAGLAVSGYDAVRAFEKGDYDEGIASSGEALMGLAPVATMAFGPAGGAVLLGVGGLLWLGGTVSKYWRKVYFKPVEKAVKKGWNKAKGVVKGAVNKVKGWFS